MTITEHRPSTDRDAQRVGPTGQPAGGPVLPAAPKVLTFEPEEHVYRLHDAATPAAWGAVLPSVTQTLQLAAVIDDTYYTEEHRTRGRYVHRMIVFDESESVDESTVDSRLRGYLDAYRRFKRETQPGHCELIEQPLCDPILRVAGTPDQVRIFGGQLALIDHKTGSPLSAHRLQTAAYEHLVRGALKCGPLKRYCLYLQASGRYRLEEHTDRRDFAVFKACLSVAHFKLANR